MVPLHSSFAAAMAAERNLEDKRRTEDGDDGSG